MPMIGGPLGTAVAILAGVIGLYVLFNAIRSRDAGSATDVATETTTRTVNGLSAVLIGAVTVFAVASEELGQFIGMIGDVAAMFPSQIAQLGILSIGAAGLGGVVDVTPGQFVAVSLALITVAVAVKN